MHDLRRSKDELGGLAGASEVGGGLKGAIWRGPDPECCGQCCHRGERPRWAEERNKGPTLTPSTLTFFQEGHDFHEGVRAGK